MFRKTNKKGFTIVELVIVIAVIAILAAVLIPTFINVTRQAEMSVDEQLVNQMNLVFAAEEAIDGKPATVVDAQNVLKANGITNYKANLADNTIYWVGSANRAIIWTQAADATTGKVSYPAEFANQFASYKTPSADWAFLATSDGVVESEIVDVEVATADSFMSAIEEAINSSEGNAMIRLPEDTKITVAASEFNKKLNDSATNNKNLTIDLNGSTFATEYVDDAGAILEIPANGHLVFSNGILDIPSSKIDNESTSAIRVAEYGSLKLQDTTLNNQNGNGVFCKAEASEVLLENCKIDVSSLGVSSNAMSSMYINMVIRNCEISASLPVMLNAPGMVTVKNSKLYGWNEAIQIRQGTAVIENSDLYTNFSLAWNLFINGKWGQANSTPCAALQIGNNNAGSSYMKVPANCTVKNTNFHTLTGTMGIYIEGNQSETIGATLNYEGCKFYFYDDDTYTNGNEISNVEPIQYATTLTNNQRAFVYSSNASGFVTINGNKVQDGQ